MPAPRKHANLPYHPDAALADHPRCQLDVHTPADAPGPAPALVWFHGGGLVEGSKDGDDAFAERLAERGIGLVTANYRYLTQVDYPGYIRDAAQAVQWTLMNGAGYGLDVGRLCIGGASAGGYLAAMLTMDRGYLVEAGVDPDVIRGSVLLSAQLTTHFAVRVQRGFRKDAIVSDEASPLFHARAGVPPLLLMTGDNDIAGRREENALFTAVLKSLGHRNISFHVIPDRDHGGVCNRIGEPGDPAATLIMDFVQGLNS